MFEKGHTAEGVILSLIHWLVFRPLCPDDLLRLHHVCNFSRFNSESGIQDKLV